MKNGVRHKYELVKDKKTGIEEWRESLKRADKDGNGTKSKTKQEAKSGSRRTQLW